MKKEEQCKGCLYYKECLCPKCIFKNGCYIYLQKSKGCRVGSKFNCLDYRDWISIITTPELPKYFKRIMKAEGISRKDLLRRVKNNDL